MDNKYKIIIFVLFIVSLSQIVLAYEVALSNETVHQYLTKEAVEVWKDIPNEIRNHTLNSITLGFEKIWPDYDDGDDTITGSAEEDSRFRFLGHFWQVDNPTPIGYIDYDDGLNAGFDPINIIPYTSSYRRALIIWDDYVIKNYVSGKKDKAYYNLGRVAHLLEDAAQPSHIHLDCHPGSEGWQYFCDSSSGDGGKDDSTLEKYTANPSVFQSYDGAAYQNQTYKYESLPGMESFNWNEVEPTPGLDNICRKCK